MHRKKGDKKIKPDKQFQPDYVVDAKKKAVTERKERKKMELENIEELKAFWKARNPKARIL